MILLAVSVKQPDTGPLRSAGHDSPCCRRGGRRSPLPKLTFATLPVSRSSEHDDNLRIPRRSRNDSFAADPLGAPMTGVGRQEPVARPNSVSRDEVDFTPCHGAKRHSRVQPRARHRVDTAATPAGDFDVEELRCTSQSSRFLDRQGADWVTNEVRQTCYFWVTSRSSHVPPCEPQA